MNNILILNLGNSKDIIFSSHLISSHKAEYPHSNISMVVFKENESIAKTITQLNNVFTIDAQTITNIINNPLYSDAFALNEFSQTVAQISESNWDKIVNYSNDTASAYLINTFEANEKIGTFIDNTGTARTSDKWSTYQNFVLTKMSRYPIAAPIVRNHIAVTPMYSDVEKIKIDPEYLFVANQNFSRIRQMNGKQAKYIVGLNLELGYDSFSLDINTISQVIETLEESEEYQVVLLTSGKSYQKELVNELNEQFNNSLVSINVDSGALSAVITNIDILVSAANDQLAYADALEVKLIEIKDANVEFRTPTTINEGNFVVYCNEEVSLASDIILALNECFETYMPITAMDSINKTHLSIQDDFGVYFTQIRGEINIQDEIDYFICRTVHFHLMGYPLNNELVEHIKENTTKDDLIEYSEKVKEELTQTVKMLLNTLRSLKGSTNSQNELNNFIQNLGTLIDHGNNDTIPGSIVRMFEGRVENITSTDPNENINSIESHLYELKNDLQVVSNVMNALTDQNQVTTENTREDSRQLEA